MGHDTEEDRIMGAIRLKFERYTPPARRQGKRQRKTWTVLRKHAKLVAQQAEEWDVDEAEVVMRAIEQYQPLAALDTERPKRGRKRTGGGDAGEAEAA